MKYRAEIDGLRALAVVPVIFFHAGFAQFSGGFVGVDIFFVISGYLITTILIDDLEGGRFDVVDFYERRARRILPALFFVMLCCIPFAGMWMLPSQLEDFSQSLIAVSLFASNILFWQESGYFEAATEEKPLLHTWSLAVEEQYYLLFPLFLLLLWRYGRSSVFWLTVALATISFLVSEWGWRSSAAANFYLAPGRAWELLAGSIAAFVAGKRGVRSNDALSLLGLTMIAFSIFAFDEYTPFPSAFTLIPVGGVFLVILSAGEETLAARLLSGKLLTGVGLISYSAYLWHQPLFAFARIRSLENPGPELMLLLILLTLVLALFTWRYVEQPFRKSGVALQSKSVLFGASLVGLTAFSSLGIYGSANDGLTGRFNKVLAGDINHDDYHRYVDDRYFDCEPREIAEQALHWENFLRCKQSKSGDPDWVLLGDSHAEHLFLGLAESFPGKNIVFYVLGGKPYLDNPDFEAIFDRLLSAENQKEIFLTMHYVSQLREQNDLFQGFSSVIGRMQEAGHKVTVFGDIPRYEIHPEKCLFRLSLEEAGRLCSMTSKDAVAQEKVYHDALVQISRLYSVDYYPIAPAFCGGTRCSMINDGTILYRDSDHLNIPGSIFVGEYLAQRIRSDSRLVTR